MRKSKRGQNSKGIIIFLVLALIITAITIIWLAVPWQAENQFGASSTALTPAQKWNYSLQLILAKSSLLTPVCTIPAETNISIGLGSSVNEIAIQLQAKGLIKDAASFRAYLIYKGLDTQLRAGDYQLDCSKNAVETADAIKNIYLDTVVFDILPGWRAEEIAATLPSSGIEVDPNDFLKVVKDPQGLNLPSYLPAGSSIEGLMYPGEYQISRKVTATELAQIFVDRFVQVVPESLLQGSTMNGLTAYQVIILASIVQRETFATGERPMIASVFYNRLAKGMRLETDPTVQYALGYDPAWGWWKSPLSSANLDFQSPFNTYLISGLPPAPIANPELSSIEAAANPANSNYLYFRAKCDGSGFHVFAVTFAEHVANACK
jgi:UPF0755 protein